MIDGLTVLYGTCSEQATGTHHKHKTSGIAGIASVLTGREKRISCQVLLQLLYTSYTSFRRAYHVAFDMLNRSDATPMQLLFGFQDKIKYYHEQLFRSHQMLLMDGSVLFLCVHVVLGHLCAHTSGTGTCVG